METISLSVKICVSCGRFFTTKVTKDTDAAKKVEYDAEESAQSF